jgi:hypothetical protein
VPPVFVTVEAARIPKVQAAPKLTAAADGQGGEVVKLQRKLAASVLPKVSATPVVIVALNLVLAARVAEGVKVAI